MSDILYSELLPGVIQLTLNRQERKNALSISLMQELLQSLESISPAVKIVVLEGKGTFFCSGLDLNETIKEDSKGPELLAQVLQALIFLQAITIVKVQGGASAGGNALVAACDIALASSEALFSLPELRRGMIPSIVYVLLKRLVAPRILNELILTAEPITALQAHSNGMINQVVLREALNQVCMDKIQQLLKNAPLAMQIYKKRFIHPQGLKEELQKAVELHRELRKTNEAREGIQAFIEKRPPTWIGL